jgi:hypothetical protein
MLKPSALKLTNFASASIVGVPFDSRQMHSVPNRATRPAFVVLTFPSSPFATTNWAVAEVIAPNISRIVCVLVLFVEIPPEEHDRLGLERQAR